MNQPSIGQYCSGANLGGLHEGNRATRRPRIDVDRFRIRCKGLLPDAHDLAVSYDPLRIEVAAVGLADGNTLGLYATGLSDEDIERSVEDRIEREIQAAADRLSAHELVRLYAALREP